MSSTSYCSSEYDCYNWQYSSYNRSVRTPLYPTMAYPLVYQVQVPPAPRGLKSGEKKKNNPNCFVKAFRWYTQEHKPQKQRLVSPQVTPDVAGFADWLDSKYEQFLMENQDQNQGSHRLKLTQTSIIETESMNNDICTPCTTRRCSRMKRPNRSLVYLLEPKDLPRPGSEYCHPTPNSCCSETVLVCKQYVVKSKSETNVCYNKDAEPPIDAAPMQEGAEIKDEVQNASKKTVECKASDCAQIQGKSTSKTSASKAMSQEYCKTSKYFVVETPEGPKQKKSFETKSKVSKHSSPKSKTKTQDIFCQCSNESVGKDADTQYEESNPKASAPEPKVSNSTTAPPSTTIECPCPNCLLHATNTQTIIKSSSKRPSIIKTPNTTPKCSKSSSRLNNIFCQCTQAPRSGTQDQYCLACECPSINNRKVCCENKCGNGQQAITCTVTREKVQSRCSFSCPSRTRPLVTESKTRSTCCTLLVNENVQTSDHSIILDANTIHGYPLFMRIVCADKLYDECSCQKRLLIEEKIN